MRIDVLFAAVPTADFGTTLAWYERLLGRPAEIVAKHDEVMWQVAAGGWLYLVGDPVRAGHGLVTLAVADLDDVLAEVHGRGLTPGRVELIGDVGRKASFTDPEGNTMVLIEVNRSRG